LGKAVQKGKEKAKGKGRTYFFFVEQAGHSVLPAVQVGQVAHFVLPEVQETHSFFVSQEEHSFLDLQQLAQEARDRVKAARARAM
jgi:hypothetical protein